MWRKLTCIFILGLAACGGEEPSGGSDMHIAFKMHALECERPGMLARLEATGLAGHCPLTVNADRTVSGVCRGVKAGELRIFRLVYYIEVDGAEVQLAAVVEPLDLTDEKREEVTIEFSPANLKYGVEDGFDDDADGVSNLHEFCRGTNPRVRD